MAGRVHGKVVVVTGAAGGIGAATSARLRAEDAHVVGVDVRPTPDVDDAIVADVTD
jgi:NAD(P)-dependent dehydrogenase (short-subunit alcohol dehydrogenase family)